MHVSAPSRWERRSQKGAEMDGGFWIRGVILVLVAVNAAIVTFVVPNAVKMVWVVHAKGLQQYLALAVLASALANLAYVMVLAFSLLVRR